MVKKGLVQEIFSKALHADDPSSYKIIFRDFEFFRELSLPSFIEESKNFEKIPIGRIELIKKDKKILYRKYQTR